MRRLAPLVVLLGACLAIAPVAAARSWTVALGADVPAPGGGSAHVGSPPARARGALHDLRRGDDTLEFGIGHVDGGPAAAAGWRRTVAAGPLGTLVLDARTGVDAGGVGLAVAARGTLGPVALRLEAAAGTRAPAPWSVVARAPTTPPTADLAPLAGPGGGARLDLAANAVWRIDRRWTVDLAPRAHRSGDGWAGAAAASLRRAEVAPDIDLSVRLDLAFGALAHHAVAGLTVHHAPRRAPESQLTVWWGIDAAAAGPGLELAWVLREGAAQATLAGALGPRWSDRPEAHLAATLQRAWGPGTVHVGARWVASGATSFELAWVMTTDR